MSVDDRDPNSDEDFEDLSDEDEGGFLVWCGDIARTWGPAILVVLLIRSAIAEPFRIPSGSMVPTLAIGDHILVTKYSYGFRIPLTRIPIGDYTLPERGDVAVFVYPGSDEGRLSYWMDTPIPFVTTLQTIDYVKRIVGLPGDTMEVRDNVLYVNGEAQTRTLVERYEFVDDRCRSHPTKEYTETFGDKEHAILNATTFGMRMADYGPAVVPDDHVFAMGDNRDHSADSRVWGYVPLRNLKGKARFVWFSYDHCEGNIPLFGSFRTDRFGEPIK